MTEQDMSGAIKVRKVTNIHSNWSEQGRGEPGKFSFQMILDDGAEEHVVRPPAEDADVLMDLISSSDDIHVDTERGVLIFNNLSLA